MRSAPIAQAIAMPTTAPPIATQRELRRRRPTSENAPVAAPRAANLNATSPDASLIRLSPFRMCVMRAGSGSRAVIDAVATASVGDTIAPSANAATSGSDGISACIA